MNRFKLTLTALALVAVAGSALAYPTAERVDVSGTAYRTVQVDGLDIFYREAGPADAPVRAPVARLPHFVAHVSRLDPRAG